MGALMYAESKDGLHWIKPELGVVDYPWNGTHLSPLQEKTNLVLIAKADPNRAPSAPNRFRHCVGDPDGMGRSGSG